jgi:DNA modification methylase
MPAEEVAAANYTTLQYAWSVALEDKPDIEKLAALDIKVQPYDVWNFSGCNDLFGDSYPGRIPGELVAHVLYFYTKPGDFVIDPMLGSGTTADVCLVMGRKCYGYDIENRCNRADSIEHDLAKKGWHERATKAKLIFWDPPYFDKKDDTKEKDGYGEGSVSKLPRQEYLAFFKKALKGACDTVKKGTRLAFLMSDWNDNEGKQDGLFVWDYSKLLQGAGWNIERHIQVPLSTQQVHPDIVVKFRESRKLARLGRYLLIARK